MDDMEETPKDIATVPPAQCFPLNLQGSHCSITGFSCHSGNAEAAGV